MGTAAQQDRITITGIDRIHEIEPARVTAIVEHVQQHGWDLPAVVVVEDVGNGVTPLDGHHRCAAAEQLGLEIPAWVVARRDLDALLEEEFGGRMPDRLVDLRECIRCGGVTADEVAPHPVRPVRATKYYWGARVDVDPDDPPIDTDRAPWDPAYLEAVGISPDDHESWIGVLTRAWRGHQAGAIVVGTLTMEGIPFWVFD